MDITLRLPMRDCPDKLIILFLVWRGRRHYLANDRRPCYVGLHAPNEYRLTLLAHFSRQQCQSEHVLVGLLGRFAR